MSRVAFTLHFHNDETLRNLERTAEALGVSIDDLAEVAIERALAEALSPHEPRLAALAWGAVSLSKSACGAE